MPPQFMPPQFMGAQVPPAPKKSWFARHKIMTGALGLLVVSAAAAGFNGGGNESSTTSQDQLAAAVGRQTTTGATKQKVAQPAKPAPAAAMPGVGTLVHHRKFDFTIASVKCGVTMVGDEYLDTTAQGQFCLVKLTVKNTGNDESMFMADDQKLLDKDGKEYSYSSEGTIYAAGSSSEKSIWLESINPGNAVTGTLVYDLPKGVKPTKIHMTDGGFTDEGVDIALS